MTAAATVISAGGKNITGWTEIALTRAISQTAPTFRLTCPADPTATAPLKLGERLVIKDGADTLATCWIEVATTSLTERSSTIIYEGRGLTADIIDTSAPFMRFDAGTTLATIAEQICAAAAVQFQSSTASSATIDAALATKPGETCLQLLARAAAAAEAVLLETPAGELTLYRPDGSGNELKLSASPKVRRQRISLAEIFYSHSVLAGDADQNNDAVIATSTSTITTRRARRLIRRAKADATPEHAARMADWSRRRADATYLSQQFTIIGWRTAAGALLHLGDRLRRPAQKAGISQPLILSGIIYRHSATAGKIAEISATLPAAWTPAPPAEPTDEGNFY